MPSLARSLTLTLALVTGACASTELGPCDIHAMEAARRTVTVDAFEGDITGLAGQPLFEGQALLTASCGNGGFCHSRIDSLASRFGAPAGFGLDVGLACDARAPSSGCSAEAREGLREAQRDVVRWRHAIFAEVERGTMPPGAQGAVVRALAPSFVRLDGTPLPELDTEEGRAILRGWLACGAPVVERAEDVTDGREVGEYCGDVVVGDCVYGAPRQVDPPEPTWDSIYERVIEPRCVSCHGPGPTDYRVESALDLSTADVAHADLVDRVGTGAYCVEEERTLVIPGDPARSLFVDKLVQEDVCGDRMPQGGPFFPDVVVEAIRAWIEAGASR